jgi:hypothetical protein
MSVLVSRREFINHVNDILEARLTHSSLIDTALIFFKKLFISNRITLDSTS